MMTDVRKCFLVFIVSSIATIVLFTFYCGSSLSAVFIEEVAKSAKDTQSLSMESKYGYVLATHYSDQITGSMANMMSLQCWASTLPGKVRLVEPLIHHQTVLGFSLDMFHHIRNQGQRTAAESVENKVKLSDIFNMNTYPSSLYFVSWDYFIRNTPRQLIIVDQNETAHKEKELADFYDSDNFVLRVEEFALHYEFQIVRRVYIEHRLYLKKDFESIIYGSFKPQETVVIFNHYGGIDKNGDVFRVRLDLDKCNKRQFSALQLSSSLLVRKKANAYIEEFLHNGVKKGYIAVMIRMEYILKKNHFENLNREEKVLFLKEYFDGITKQVNTWRKQFNLTNVFLSVDTNKYGTRSLELTGHNNTIKEAIKIFYKNVFSGTATESEMTRRLENIVEVPISGFIAQIEKNIAANATCLLLAGGGSYQGSASKLYKLFSDENNQKECLIELC